MLDSLISMVFACHSIIVETGGKGIFKLLDDPVITQIEIGNERDH